MALSFLWRRGGGGVSQNRPITWPLELISYAHPHNFMLMLRYCCNQKILHLERAIGPHIRLYSQQFDYLIDTTYAQYFDINFAANVDLAAIRSNEHALSHDNLIQLARVQLRALPIDGGLDLPSMLDVDLPAFYVAQVCIYKNSFTKNTVDPCLYKMKAPLGQSFQQSVPGFTQSSP